MVIRHALPDIAWGRTDPRSRWRSLHLHRKWRCVGSVRAVDLSAGLRMDDGWLLCMIDCFSPPLIISPASCAAKVISPLHDGGWWGVTLSAIYGHSDEDECKEDRTSMYLRLKKKHTHKKLREKKTSKRTFLSPTISHFLQKHFASTCKMGKRWKKIKFIFLLLPFILFRLIALHLIHPFKSFCAFAETIIGSCFHFPI
jgi:hypothetical protein